MTIKSKIVIDFDPSSAKKYAINKYGIVVVDVLRASSTIIIILSQGAKEVIPCVEIEETEYYRKSLDAVLVGERKGTKISGFDYTNSPFDLSKVNLESKIIAITTSTGTRLINESIGAKNILIGSTLNASEIARRMHKLGGNWAVLGAGTRGEFRPEDQVGCALIVKYFMRLSNCIVNSQTRNIVNTYSDNIETHIRMSSSSQKLIEIGQRNDVDFVINSLNKYTIVPVARKIGSRVKITQ